MRAALGRDRGGVRELEHPPGDRLPEAARHPGHHGHRGQRRGDGLRQHGRGLRNRRGLHPRSLDRRAGRCTANTCSTPRARTWCRASGRRCRSRRSSEKLPARLPGARAGGSHPGAALPRRAGHGVHHRAGRALHAPDPAGPALGPGGGADRLRHGGRGADLGGGGGRPDPAQRSEPAAASDHRPHQQARPAHHRPAGQPRRRLRHRGVRRRPGREDGASRSARHPGPPGDVAGGFPRHGGGQGDPHRPRRHDLARGGGRARHGQALRGRRAGDPGGRDGGPVLGERPQHRGGRMDHGGRRHRQGVRRQGGAGHARASAATSCA